MDDHRRERHAHRMLAFAAILLAWALVIGLTGGFVLSLGGLRLSSRSMRNALIGCSLCVAAAWAMAPPGRRKQLVVGALSRLTEPIEAAVATVDRRILSRVADMLVAATVVAVIVIGITKGSFVAGGSDSYGYVSQAHLWVTGDLRLQPPVDGQLPDGLSYSIFTPLGYRLGPDGRTSVPTYAPGFPMLMAVFERLAGPDAVFYVMPLLAGVTVAGTYLLGIIVSGRLVGLLATVLMAMSPTFLFQLTHAPMSDIAAAGWWTLALVLLPRGSRLSSLVMGLCAAAAILTRPNLVPLAIVPGTWLVREVLTSAARGLPLARLTLYAIGPLCACLLIAALNRSLYGSATESGYGALAGALFRWSYVWPNVVNYSRSMLETQTPAILLAIAGPFLASSPIAMAYVSFAAVTYLCYAMYLPLDAWWSLRFFLPAFPIIFVYVSVSVVRVPAFLPLGPHVLCSIVLAVFMCAEARGFVRDMGVLDSTGERRFAEIGRYIADTLPPRAVLFAVLHSGSVKHYSGRATVRWDAVNAEQLEAVASRLRQQGHPLFIVLDEFEREEFVRRFGPAESLGILDTRAATLVPTVELYQMR